MIGLGQINTIGNSSNRIHEMRLFREVARVDEKEAEQGVRHSDVLRLNSRKDEEDGLLKKGLTRHLAKLWQTVKSKTTGAETDSPEDDCPVAKARAQSEVGENAPLGWLTYDQMAGTEASAPGMETVASKSAPAKADAKDSLAFLKTDPEDHDYMFCEEWFLSPCG
jgi:hypothetical protein